MLAELGGDFTTACPAFRANALTIYKSNLFVGDIQLSESGMKNHPLTPMTDSNLVRVLAPQTLHKVAGCYHETVKQGVDAVRAWVSKARADGYGVAVLDAMDDADLGVIAAAFDDAPLLTGASGLAYGLARTVFGGGAATALELAPSAMQGGSRAVISGSCSTATNGQVEKMLQDHEGFRIDVEQLARGQDVVKEALDWAKDRLGQKPVLFYATTAPDQVKANQAKFGVAEAGTMVESALSKIAKELVDRGVSELIVAGGGTSGAVVKSLGINQLTLETRSHPESPGSAHRRRPAGFRLR